MAATPNLETRDAKRFVEDIRRRIAGYVPAWRPGERGADAALLAIAARYFAAIGTRLNHTPDKNLLAFLDTAGIQRIPAQSARAPMIFRTTPQSGNNRFPQGNRVAAPPPPGSNDQIVFETESDIALAAAQLKEVVSVHPGRDQFADHSLAYLAGSPFQIFSALEDTEHVFYLGHREILNLSGDVTLKVGFGLAANSSERLDILWQYWDGQVWRPFVNVLERCDEEVDEDLDGTNGLTRSGPITLKAGCAETKPVAVNGIETFWVRGKLLEPLPADPSQVLPLVETVKLKTVINRPLFCGTVQDGVEVVEQCAALDLESPDVTIKTGLIPDKAFAGSTALDLTKAFFPLGQQPQPGVVFYFTNEELFSKPRARAQVLIKTALTPEAKLNIEPGISAISQREDLIPEVAWEYWNGTDWIAVSLEADTGTDGDNVLPQFQHTGVFNFVIPEDMTSLKVNEEEAKWMRARLLSGGYGFVATVAWSDSRSQNPNQFSYVVPQPPAIAEFRLGYVWESFGEPPEAALGFNDFQYQDFSQQARYPGRPFLPYSRMDDTTPALYLGFDGKLPVDFVSLFSDIVEKRGGQEGPELIWEYWDGGAWRRVTVQDETGNLSRPGMVALIGPEDSAALARFGTSLLLAACSFA